MIYHGVRCFEYVVPSTNGGMLIGHFTVVCFVTWPCVGSEAGGDLVLIQTSLLFICKCKLVSMGTA